MSMNEQSMNKIYNEHLKILLIGKSGVGKTSIVYRFMGEDNLPQRYHPTIAVQARSANRTIEGKNILISLYDSPGNEGKYGSVTRAYWHSSRVFIFVVSADDEDSFRYAKEKFDIIFRENDDRLDFTGECTKIILYNKNDIENPELSLKSVKDFATALEIKSDECSAIQNAKCVETIEDVLKSVVKGMIRKEQDGKKIRKEGKLSKFRRKICCCCFRSQSP